MRLLQKKFSSETARFQSAPVASGGRDRFRKRHNGTIGLSIAGLYRFFRYYATGPKEQETRHSLYLWTSRLAGYHPRVGPLDRVRPPTLANGERVLRPKESRYIDGEESRSEFQYAFPHSSDFARRRFLSAGSLTVAAGYLFPLSLVGQTDDRGGSIVAGALKESAKAKLTVTRLHRNVSVISGGGDIAVLTGPDGKVLVDAGIVTAHTNLSKALASVSNDPITRLINTHWHFDHTGGNEWLKSDGASILAHENTRKHLSETTRVGGNWHFVFPAAPIGAIPSTVFKGKHTLHVNDTELLLSYYLPAHTDSDISVYFAEADVLHTGDTFWNRDYPFVDYGTGGSIDGHIRAAEANLAKVSDETIVIPGHGAVGGKADLVLFRDVLVDIREKVAILKKNGRTLTEVIASRPSARWDGVWANSFRDRTISPPSFIRGCEKKQRAGLVGAELSSLPARSMSQ
jgi:glyoxylase-like metal-dependent hydrolase (beta-lactamase superfamily II)